MDHRSDNSERVLHVRLDVCLDRQPVSGLLRTERGAEEPFVGWLGFVETLQRLRDLPSAPDPHATGGTDHVSSW